MTDFPYIIEEKFSILLTSHCESGEGIWLQGEAASEAHSFRDAEPHPVIPENAKNNYGIFPKKPKAMQ